MLNTAHTACGAGEIAPSRRISIIVAVYCGNRYLPELLASLFAQTLPPDEIIISDDASPEDPAEIIASFSAAHPGVIRYFRNVRRLGVAANFAQGLAKSSGDIIFLADQDDIWEREKVAALAAAIEKAPTHPAGAFCDSRLVDASGRGLGVSHWQLRGFNPAEFTPEHQFELICRRAPLAAHNLAIERELLDKVLPFPELDGVHDNFIALMVGAVGVWQVVDQRLTRFRQHSGNLSRMYADRGKLAQAKFALTAHRDAYTAEMFDFLWQKLVEMPGVSPEKLALVAARRDFSRARSNLSKHFVLRIFPVLKLLISGNYRRFGRGMVNFWQDLFLRSIWH